MKTALLLHSFYKSPPPGTVPTAISRDEGLFLRDLVQQHKPKTILEIGLGCGLSALWLESGAFQPNKHIIVEQNLEAFDGLGKTMIQRSGLKHVQLIESLSQKYLASITSRDAESIDFVFLDADQRFDGIMTDMYFITKLLRVDGIVIVRNMWNPSVRKAIWFYYKNLPFTLVYSSTCPTLCMRQLSYAGPLAFHTVCKLMTKNYAVLQKISKDHRPWYHFIRF